MFKRFHIVVLTLLLLSAASHAQLNKFAGVCVKQDQPANVMCIPSSMKYPRILPGVFTINGYGTSAPLTVYSDSAGRTKATTLKCASGGTYTFYASASYADLRLSGADVPSPFVTTVAAVTPVASDVDCVSWAVCAASYPSFSAAVDAAASLGKPLVISNQQSVTTKTIPSGVTVYIVKGGSINVSTSLAFAPGSNFSAPPFQVFSGPGEVKLCVNDENQCLIPEAYAEWWGAQADNLTDSGAAINKALASHYHVKLLNGAYKTSAAISVKQTHQTLEGAGIHSTVIISTSDSADILKVVGPVAFPSPNEWSDIHIRRLFLTRSTAPRTPTQVGTDTDDKGPMGMRFTNVIRVFVDEVISYNSFNEFYLNNTINIFLNRCYALRDAGGAVDRWVGFNMDGLTNAGTGISPNASTRMTDCIANPVYPGASTGFLIQGRISDQFLIRPETASAKTGILIKGIPNDSTRTQIDVHILEPILDAYTDFGIKFQDISPFGLVSVVGGYAAVKGGAPTGIGLYITNAQGVSVTSGFQVIGFPGKTMGLAIDGSSRGNSVDIYAQDCDQPVVISKSGYNKVTGQVTQITITPTHPAITISGAAASRNVIEVGVVAPLAHRFDTSIYLENAGGANEINLTRVDPTAHSRYRALVNNTEVKAVGAVGGNLFTEVF